jgi:hypothetical protein
MSIERIVKAEKKPQTISEIAPIEESRGQLIKSRESIKNIFEAPLVRACEQLYENNIMTISTSANSKDVAIGYGGIVIDYEHLSPENRQIAKSLGELDEDNGMQTVYIKIPISPDATPNDISRAAESIASEFKPQDPTWLEPYTYTFEQMKEMYGISDEKYPDMRPEDFIDQEDTEGQYYDSESGLFYPSKELFQKAVNLNKFQHRPRLPASFPHD